MIEWPLTEVGRWDILIGRRSQWPFAPQRPASKCAGKRASRCARRPWDDAAPEGDGGGAAGALVGFQRDGYSKPIRSLMNTYLIYNSHNFHEGTEALNVRLTDD